MKKLLSILLTVVVFCGISITFCSCGNITPELNFEKARKNLKDNGYVVELDNAISAGDGWLKYAFENTLYAAEENGDNWIQIIEFKNVKVAKLFCEITDGVLCQKEINFMEYILEKYGDDMKSAERDELDDEIKEYKEELAEERYYRKGKYVWCGTDSGINDTKG